jgi:acetylornithine/N-succinyldiaminopimelate aminotransferase
LLEKAAELGEYAKEKLSKLVEKYHIIDHVRGVGLMIGVQLTGPGAKIVEACLEKGLRINCTHDTVIRFMLPMIVTKEQIDKAIEIFESVLAESKE